MKASSHVCLLALSALATALANAVVGAFAPSAPSIFGVGRNLRDARRATACSMSAVVEAPAVAAAPGMKVDGLRFVW
jgi:hypothetical protein